MAALPIMALGPGCLADPGAGMFTEYRKPTDKSQGVTKIISRAIRPLHISPTLLFASETPPLRDPTILRAFDTALIMRTMIFHNSDAEVHHR